VQLCNNTPAKPYRTDAQQTKPTIRLDEADGKNVVLKMTRLIFEFSDLVKLANQDEKVFQTYYRTLGQVSQKLLAFSDLTLMGTEIKLKDICTQEEIEAYVESLVVLNIEVQDLPGAQPWTAEFFFNKRRKE